MRGHYSFIGVASSQLSQSEHTINWYKDNPHKLVQTMSPVADYKEAEQADFDKLKAFLKEVL